MAKFKSYSGLFQATQWVQLSTGSADCEESEPADSFCDPGSGATGGIVGSVLWCRRKD